MHITVLYHAMSIYSLIGVFQGGRKSPLVMIVISRGATGRQRFMAFKCVEPRQEPGPVLLKQSGAVARLSANGSTAFEESCAFIA